MVTAMGWVFFWDWMLVLLAGGVAVFMALGSRAWEFGRITCIRIGVQHLSNKTKHHDPQVDGIERFALD